MQERRPGIQTSVELPHGEQGRKLQRTYYPTTIVLLNETDADINSGFGLNSGGHKISVYEKDKLRNNGSRRMGVVYETKYRDGKLMARVSWILCENDNVNPEISKLEMQDCWYRLADLHKFVTIPDDTPDSLNRDDLADMPVIGSSIRFEEGSAPEKKHIIAGLLLQPGHIHPYVDANGKLKIEWRFNGYFSPNEPEDTKASRLLMFVHNDGESVAMPISASIIPGLTYKKKK